VFNPGLATNGTILSNTPEQIHVIIPNKTTEINNLVRLQAPGYEFTMEETFVMNRPRVEVVSPAEFSVGEDISVIVENPNLVLAYNHFTLNDYYVEAVSIDENVIHIKIQVDLKNQTGDIYLRYSTGEWFNSNLFETYSIPLHLKP
jgi:hypothetical protein